MRNNRKYFQLIPEIVNNYLPEICELLISEIKAFNADYLKEIISIVACHVRKDEGASPLKMFIIKKLVPQGDKYLNALIDLKIVERTGQYIPGKVSYHYDFTLEYQSKFIPIELKNQKLINRIKKVYDELHKKQRKQVRGLNSQVKFLEKLTISDEAFSFLESESIQENVNRYNSYFSAITKLQNGILNFSIDETSHRFHSNVTNMPGALRPYLRCNGEPLCNIDVKNSQPYLSTIFLTNPRKVSWLTENPAFAMLLQSLKVSHKEDVKKYISLVVSGEIYEFLMAEFSKKVYILTGQKRKFKFYEYSLPGTVPRKIN
ncbi:MAG: hypothetical protein HC906_01145 [Bacteroidales bacterium]|nr:hypothetical protein [Bacteroidales bacterium]